MASEGTTFYFHQQTSTSRFAAFLSRHVAQIHTPRTRHSPGPKVNVPKVAGDRIHWPHFRLGKRKRSKGSESKCKERKGKESKGKQPKGKEPMYTNPALVPRNENGQRSRPSMTIARESSTNATSSGNRKSTSLVGRRRHGSILNDAHNEPDESIKERRDRPSTDERRSSDREVTARLSWRNLSRFIRRDTYIAPDDLATEQHNPKPSAEGRRSGAESTRTPSIGEPGPSTWHHKPSISGSCVRPLSSSPNKESKINQPSKGGSTAEVENKEENDDDDDDDASFVLSASELHRRAVEVRRDSIPVMKRAWERKAGLRLREAVQHDGRRATFWQAPSTTGTQTREQ